MHFYTCKEQRQKACRPMFCVPTNTRTGPCVVYDGLIHVLSSWSRTPRKGLRITDTIVLYCNMFHIQTTLCVGWGVRCTSFHWISVNLHKGWFLLICFVCGCFWVSSPPGVNEKVRVHCLRRAVFDNERCASVCVILLRCRKDKIPPPTCLNTSHWKWDKCTGMWWVVCAWGPSCTRPSVRLFQVPAFARLSLEQSLNCPQ